MGVDRLKWLFTFTLLGATMGWAVFTVVIVKDAMAMPNSANVLESAGAGVVTGALVAWTGNVVQYWFRKRPENREQK